MFIKVDGLDINYRISGIGMETAGVGAQTAADTLVILQGWGTDMSLYDPVAEMLGDRMRVVQFDFPGFGRSPEPPEPWRVEQYAEFFLHLMEALDIHRASLMGHSYGGRVIIELAAKAEHAMGAGAAAQSDVGFEIEKLLLVDSAGVMPQRSAQQNWEVKKYKMLKKLAGLKVSRMLCPQLIEEWQSRQGSADYRNATPLMRNALVMAVNYDQTSLLPKIKQETLLVWGENDTATPLSDGETMDRLIPDSGLAVIPGTGHYSFLERQDVFRKILDVYFPPEGGVQPEDGEGPDAPGSEMPATAAGEEAAQ